MNPNIISFLLVCACIVGFFLAFYFWRMSSGYMTILKEGANRYEDLRKLLRHSEESLNSSQRTIQQMRDSEKQLAASVRERNERMSELEKQLETKQSEFQHKLSSLDLQKGHLLKQVDQLTDKLMLAEQTLASEQEHIREKLQHSTKNRAVSDDFQKRFHEMEKLLRQKDSTIVRLEEQLQTNGPEKITQFKRRLAHYERLYSSMKSLREMADERSQNWEVALQKMSAWILMKSDESKKPENLPKSIGPLVGEALEKIGVSLVDDSAPENPTERIS